MAQTFKSKTLLGRSGIFSHQTIAPNLIYNTGNQIISGVKTFAENTTFGDSAQGDFLVISGNQFTVYGSGNFTSGLFVNGNAVLTGIDLSSYATKINLALTGSTLNFNINSLSGLFTGYTGSLDATFASDIQLANTGSTLDTKINNVSGYFTGTNETFTTNLFSTGSTLDTKINTLSGLFTGYTGNLDTTYASDSQLATTGSTLDTKINNFSGYINSPSSNIVFTTGNQSISGNKTFINNLEVQGTGIFNALDLSNISEFNFSGTNINLINGNVNISGQIYISGNPVLTGVNLSSYATTANLASTGSTLDNKINSLSGSSVLTFGNQTISGIKTFTQTGSFDTLQITNKKLSSYNYVNSNFIFGNTYINIANSSTNITGTLPSDITSGINYYVKNLNTGILLITGSGQRTIDGFSNINLYKNESLQLLGVNNVGYTGWTTVGEGIGVS